MGKGEAWVDSVSCRSCSCLLGEVIIDRLLREVTIDTTGIVDSANVRSDRLYRGQSLRSMGHTNYLLVLTE
jgi:hypothetical protein